ncbi:N-acetyltransferase 5, partial [Coemansia erecta]
MNCMESNGSNRSTRSNGAGIPMVLSAVVAENGIPVKFEQVSADTLNKVRNLNSALFPVRYSSSFYKSLTLPGQFAQLATYQGTYVGTIACRKQPLGFADSATGFHNPRIPQPELYEMYMMTLGVLAPYRRLGIGRMLLTNALNAARQDPLVARVVLH